MSSSLGPHGLQHTRPPCPSPTPRVYPSSCPLIRWYHPTISSSVIPFSSCPQSLPASGSFQMSQLFASGGQSIGISASTSVLPINSQGWKEYVKAVYFHPAYLTYRQSTSWEMPGWMKHKLESILPGEISITLDMQRTPPLWQNITKNLRASWWKWKRRVKSWLKGQHSEN